MESKQSSLLLQKSIKDNTDELHDFLADLKSWEKEMKEVDQKLSSQSNNKDNKSSGENPTAHPVRSRSNQGPAKSSLKQTEKNKGMVITNNNHNKKAKRLPCDYAAWEKFDVDKALESSEEEEEEVEHKQPISKATPSSRTPPASKKERASALKEEGNKLYSSGRLEDAVAKYTQGMALDPTNALLPANRAMAYIKLKKYTAAEADCNRCLKLDNSYIKGYLRRATARLKLGKEELARRDCLKVLEMEPGNKEATRELEMLRGASGGQQESRTSTKQTLDNDRLKREQKPVHNPPHVVREGVAVGKGNEQSEGTQVTVHKKEGSGKKLKIIEVNSNQENRIPTKANQILPIEKPPHLRSKKPLRRIPVRDVGSWKDMNEKPEVEVKEARSSSGGDGGGGGQQDKAGKVALPPKTTVLVSSKAFVPSIPKNSHQFSQDWHRLYNQAEAASEYLKMIPSTFFRNVDLETNTLVEVVEVLASEEVPPTLAAQHLSALSASHGFSISLMFLEADQKQVFLNLTSKCKQVEGHTAKMEELEAAVHSS